MFGVEVCSVISGLSKEEPIEALRLCYRFILKVILFFSLNTAVSEEDLDAIEFKWSPFRDATESKC